MRRRSRPCAASRSHVPIPRRTSSGCWNTRRSIRSGRAPYAPTLEAMRRFTPARTDTPPDELWLLDHPPVYTLGQGAAPVQVANGIPVLAADRGGEVTYHGPGQVVVYTLVDLTRRAI